MKYCVRCGHPVEDESLFCPRCGTRCGSAPPQRRRAALQDRYREYWDQQYYDRDSGRTIELTPEGVYIFSRRGIRMFHWDKIIPYSQIVDVFFQRASVMKKGVLSVVTITEGISGPAKRQQMRKDFHTLFFSRKEESQAEGICQALQVICSAPPHGTACPDDARSRRFTDPVTATRRRNRMASLLSVLLILCLIGLSFRAPSARNTSAPGSNAARVEEGDILCDVSQFACISGEELVALRGEPDSISEGTCSGAFAIPCVYYEYSGDALLDEVSFALVNGRVVRFTAYKDFPRFDKKNILARLGVEKGENCALVADTGTALRYRCPSEAVDDIWCNLIDNDTFGFLQVTYDMQYYEEWYLTLSNDEFYAYRYNTENVITSLLTFPESAEFPWNNENWHIAKNAFYVIVQSYVDAHNAFGAKVRNQFTCIYARTTGDILYAVFDGEVIADNGYVPTEELVFQLAGEGGG